MHCKQSLILSIGLALFAAGCSPRQPANSPKSDSSASKPPLDVRKTSRAPVGPSAGADAVADQQVVDAPPQPDTPEIRAWRDAMTRLGPNETLRGQTWIGPMGVTETVDETMARERALGGAVPSVALTEFENPARRTLPPNPLSVLSAVWPLPEEGMTATPIRPRRPGGPLIPQTISTSFQTIQISESGFRPPDTHGAVGPTQYLCCLNGRIKVFAKGGGLGPLNTGTNNFFSAVKQGAANAVDPRVSYDRTSNRWIVCMIDTIAPNRILLAISNGSAVTGSTGFIKFGFQHDLVGTTPNSDTGGFADYPSLGVDKDAVYVGINEFNAAGNAVIGTTGYVINKQSMISGGPLVVTAFRQMATGSSGAGPWSPRGCDNDDPASTNGYFIGVDNSMFSRLVMRRISDPGGTPAISGNINLTVPNTTSPASVNIFGSPGNPLDGLDDRLFEAAVYLDQASGQRSIWTAHSFRVSSAGTASTGVGNRMGSRWYQIGDLDGALSLVQSGTVFDPAGAAPDAHWIPSIAMSLQGHAALGCSRAGANRRAEIAVAGRLASDALGSMDASVIAQSSTSDYNVDSGTQRWGDYSDVSVDPVDGMTLWTAQEYCNATNSWAVRAIKLLAPPPATPDSANPPQVAQGATNVNVDVTGVSSAGSGFFDPDVSYPNHISASVDGTGVTVNSVTFTDPTHITLNISVTGGATPGLRTITVTNPDGQMTASGGGILEVIAPCSLPGDVNTNGTIDADDVQGFVDCVLTGSTSNGDCACANITLAAFLGLLL